MRSGTRQLLTAFCGLITAASVFGCAAPRVAENAPVAPSSVIILLPEGGEPSGEVTVTTAKGTQVLNQSWQSVAVAGSDRSPAPPVLLAEKSVREDFKAALAAMPAPPAHYLLYFKLDSTELVPESRSLLPEIARVIGERHPAQLSVVGHADTTGSVNYDYLLGRRRAGAVVEELVSQGAAPVAVEISSRGKSEPLVHTPDQTLEPRNRRVEVTVR